VLKRLRDLRAEDTTDIAGLSVVSPTTRSILWVQTESEKIQSKVILSKVIEQLQSDEAWPKPRRGGNLQQRNLPPPQEEDRFSSDPKTGVVDIRVKSDSPDEAARIPN